MDISIIPLHIAAHPQCTRYSLCPCLKVLTIVPVLYTATAYAIGELGVDIIRNRVEF